MAETAQQAPAPQQAAKPQEKPQAAAVQKPQTERPLDGYRAEIMEILPGKTGMFGNVRRAMCKVLDGKDKGRVIRRNIVGRIKQGDVIRLTDTSREDRDIVVK